MAARNKEGLAASMLHVGERCLAQLWQKFDSTYFPLQLLIYVFLFPLLELAFVFRVRRFLRVRSAQRQPHHTADTAEVERFWTRILTEEDGRTADAILRGWFLGEGPIGEGNMEELVAWTLYAKPPHALAGARRAKVARVLARLLQRTSPFAPYPAGRNPRRVCMLHTLEPLDACWKPLLFYLAVQTVRELAWAVLRRRGFELRAEGALQYWCHPGRSQRGADAAPAPPIVVLHGVGGLTPYLPLLLQLRAVRPSSPLLVPFLPHCSLLTPAFDPPPPLDTTALVRSLAAVVERHGGGGGGGGGRAIFFAHSLGTALLASVIKEFPRLVGGALFVDPICFLLYKHDVVHNFLYHCPAPLRHGPRQALHVGYWFRLALHYLLRCEPTIQSAFRREFWWGRHWLHPADVPCAAYVSLSGRDAIVPSHEVRSYLRQRAEAARADDAARWRR